jgi:hypothetical protein
VSFSCEAWEIKYKLLHHIKQKQTNQRNIAAAIASISVKEYLAALDKY